MEKLDLNTALALVQYVKDCFDERFGKDTFYFKQEGSLSKLILKAIPKLPSSDMMPFIANEGFKNAADFFGAQMALIHGDYVAMHYLGRYEIDFDLVNQEINFYYDLGQWSGTKRFDFDSDEFPIFENFDELIRFKAIEDEFNVSHAHIIFMNHHNEKGMLKLDFCLGWCLEKGDNVIDIFKTDFVEILNEFGATELREIVKELLGLVRMEGILVY